MDLKINSLQDIEIFESSFLGSGFISVVKKGRHIPTGTPLAIKIVD